MADSASKASKILFFKNTKYKKSQENLRSFTFLIDNKL